MHYAALTGIPRSRYARRGKKMGRAVAAALPCLILKPSPDCRVAASGRLGDKDRIFSLPLRISHEVDRAVQAPYRRQHHRDNRFLPATEAFQRSDDVEREAREVGEGAEDRHHHVLEAMELA